MFPLVLLVLVASVTTASWYDPYEYNNGYQERMDKFWDNFDQKMKNLNKKIEKAVKSKKSSSQINGDEYKITIYMTGFDKEDIVVKAKQGNLVIQAIHNVPGEPVNNYVDVRNLPDFVDGNGSWTYIHGKLTIVFPIKERGGVETTDSTLPYGTVKSGENNDTDEDEDADSSNDTDSL